MIITAASPTASGISLRFNPLPGIFPPLFRVAGRYNAETQQRVKVNT